jgi:hypothetical protein
MNMGLPASARLGNLPLSKSNKTMKTKKKVALTISGLFAAAILAGMPLTASAADLVAYYTTDSFYYSGGSSGIPYTPNSVAGFGDAAMQYSGGQLYQNTINPDGYIGGAFEQLAGGQARLSFGSWSPFTATDSFTYALWMYTPAGFPSGSVGQFLLSKFSANNSTGCEFKMLLRGNDLQFITISGASSQVTAQTAALSTVGATTADAWNHFAITASKSGGTVTWGAYVNGEPISFATSPTQNISSSASTVAMSLGMPAFSNLNFAPAGVMADEIRFYDGVLSQAEVMTLVPEPSSFALVAFGGLMLFLRRRF